MCPVGSRLLSSWEVIGRTESGRARKAEAVSCPRQYARPLQWCLQVLHKLACLTSRMRNSFASLSCSHIAWQQGQAATSEPVISGHMLDTCSVLYQSTGAAVGFCELSVSSDDTQGSDAGLRSRHVCGCASAFRTPVLGLKVWFGFRHAADSRLCCFPEHARRAFGGGVANAAQVQHRTSRAGAK